MTEFHTFHYIIPKRTAKLTIVKIFQKMTNTTWFSQKYQYLSAWKVQKDEIFQKMISIEYAKCDSIEGKMGFLDFLFGGSEEAQLKRHAKKVVNLNSQLEERQASAQWLAANGTEEAISALLKRFALTYEQRMKDADENDQHDGDYAARRSEL